MTATIANDDLVQSLAETLRTAATGIELREPGPARPAMHGGGREATLVLDRRSQHRPRRDVARRFHAARAKRLRERSHRRAPPHLHW